MAKEHLRHWTVGDVRVTRIVEVNNHQDPLAVLLEDGSPDLMKKYDWLRPHFATEDGDMLISFQCFIVETPNELIMFDTCIGNDRQREYDIFCNMQGSFLEDLEAAGYKREDVTTVLCTHLHFDHVGWNTMLQDGKWVPTFPNARYLFGQKEWDLWQEKRRRGEPHMEHLSDSIEPIIDAGLAQFIGTEYQVTDELALFPTPGHTPGHVSALITSKGKEAVLTGDLMHHPIQMALPEHTVNFDMDKEAGKKTRVAFLQRFQDRKAFIIASHFCDPTAGWIVKDDENWRFEVEE
ncbi:MAG TPA: MBL fold metallo-hydrolase [Alphaproteobacteria bacterium]|nr:MBL fold metallo-hydrolase [Alphaproteobacteria bacterium]